MRPTGIRLNPGQPLVADEDDDRLLRRQDLLNGVNAVETDKKRSFEYQEGVTEVVLVHVDHLIGRVWLHSYVHVFETMAAI